MTPVGPEVVPLLIIIMRGIPHAFGLRCRLLCTSHKDEMKQLDPRGLSQCPASFVGLPAATTCASSLNTSMQRATSPSLFPWERERTFFSSWRIALHARKSEVGDQEAEWRCARWHLLQGRKHRGHGAPRRSLLGRSWPTEVTSQQPTSAARAWEGTRCHLQLPHQQ